MARIRTIKPEFWTNEELAETSEPARLLAIGLLNHSDDEGYFKAHKSLIKAVIFPLTEPSMSIHECLKQLSNAGYLRLFIGSDGKEYGKVINFDLHQRVNRPTESKIKKLDSFTECSLKTHGVIAEPSPPEGKGKEGKGSGKESSYVPPAGDTYPEEFEEIWQLKPKREGGNPKNHAYGAYKASLKRGATAEEIKAGVIRYKEYCDRKGLTNTDKVQQMRTFFGKSEGFREEWTVTQETVRYEQNRGSGNQGQQGDYNGDGWAEGFDPLADPFADLIDGSGSENR